MHVRAFYLSLVLMLALPLASAEPVCEGSEDALALPGHTLTVGQTSCEDVYDDGEVRIVTSEESTGASLVEDESGQEIAFAGSRGSSDEYTSSFSTGTCERGETGARVGSLFVGRRWDMCDGELTFGGQPVPVAFGYDKIGASEGTTGANAEVRYSVFQFGGEPAQTYTVAVGPAYAGARFATDSDDGCSQTTSVSYDAVAARQTIGGPTLACVDGVPPAFP